MTYIPTIALLRSFFLVTLLLVSSAGAQETQKYSDNQLEPPPCESGWRELVFEPNTTGSKMDALRAIPDPGDFTRPVAIGVFRDGRVIVREGEARVTRFSPRADARTPERPEEIVPDAAPATAEAIMGWVADLSIFSGPTPGAPFPIGADPDNQGVILGGSDERHVVTNLDTLRSYPWRTIGAIVNDASPNSPRCTGTMVGPRHVLTAAHCIYDKDGWFPLSALSFAPGMAASNDPNGERRRAVGRFALLRNSVDLDYGIIVLEDRAETAALGWMALWWYRDDLYANKWVHNNGYPLADNNCAASPQRNGECGGFMYGDFCNIADEHGEGHLLYDCDTQVGHSGSPIWRFIEGVPMILAINKRGNEPGSGAVIVDPIASYNVGPRVRPSMYADICDWIGQSPSQFADHQCE